MSRAQRPARRQLLVAGLLAGAVAAATTVAHAATSGRRPGAAARRPPVRLADTGLYADFASGTVDARNLPYTPQYPLWSDGASKRRWIRLPPGKSIDARDPERWVFPVGTRLWKEFAWGRRVETRYLELTGQGWIYGTYVWTDDGSDAVLAPEDGVLSDYEVAPGRRHAIPGVADCKNCHRGGRSEVLGFGALQLSPDRDPLAPHAEPELPGALTLPVLLERRLMRNLPEALVRRPPRIAAATPRERAALGYLHGNCGGCHDTAGPLATLGLALRYPVAPPPEGGPPAVVGRPSRWRAPGAASGASRWIDPGRPASSTVLVRMASRSPATQMPPLGTQLVDEDAVALLRGWIEEDLRAGEGKSSADQP